MNHSQLGEEKLETVYGGSRKTPQAGYCPKCHRHMSKVYTPVYDEHGFITGYNGRYVCSHCNPDAA